MLGQVPPHESGPPHLPEQAGTHTQVVPFEHFFDCVMQLFPHAPQLVSVLVYVHVPLQFDCPLAQQIPPALIWPLLQQMPLAFICPVGQQRPL